MSRYRPVTGRLITELFWASARGFEHDGRPEQAAQARESARLSQHGYRKPADGGSWPSAERRTWGQ